MSRSQRRQEPDQGLKEEGFVLLDEVHKIKDTYPLWLHVGSFCRYKTSFFHSYLSGLFISFKKLIRFVKLSGFINSNTVLLYAYF